MHPEIAPQTSTPYRNTVHRHRSTCTHNTRERVHTHLNRQKHRYTYTPSTWTHPHRPSTHTDTPLNIYILIGFPGLAKSVRRGWKDPPRQVLWLFAAQVPTYLLRAGLLQQPLGLVPPCSPSTSPLPPCPSFASSMELDLPWMTTGLHIPWSVNKKK